MGSSSAWGVEKTIVLAIVVVAGCLFVVEAVDTTLVETEQTTPTRTAVEGGPSAARSSTKVADVGQSAGWADFNEVGDPAVRTDASPDFDAFEPENSGQGQGAEDRRIEGDLTQPVSQPSQRVHQ